MADEIIFETEDGRQIGEPKFRRTRKGVPSLPLTFYARNISDNHIFRGQIYVSPVEGKSYTEDIYISPGFGQGVWSKALNLDIPPADRVPLRLRIVPRVTPSGDTGKAAIVIGARPGISPWITI